MADQEMIAVKLDAIAQAMAQAAGLMACCVRTPNLTEIGIPFHAMPFWFAGEIFQFQGSGGEGSINLQQSVLFSSPQGQNGVITAFGVGERFPGAMAGVRVSLLVNGEAIPQFPRVAGLIGNGTGDPLAVWIPLPASAEVSLMTESTWVTTGFTQPFLGFGVPWSIKGYYLDSEYYAAAQNNSAAPVGAVGSDPTNYQNVQIPEINIASTIG